MEINSDDFVSYSYFQTKEKYFKKGFKTKIYVENSDVYSRDS